MSQLILKNYFVEHRMKEPSKISDYDYDPWRPDRRFITTYLHSLAFCDLVTESQVLSLSFCSEICAKIIATLYEMIIETDSHPNKICSTIDGVFVDNMVFPSKLVFTKSDNKNINIAVLYYEQSSTLSLTTEDAQSLADLLDNEVMEDMFILDSTDRRTY